MVKIECIETGQVFKSIAAAAKSINANSSSIANSIRLGYACFGYHFKRQGDAKPNVKYTNKAEAICISCKNTNLNDCSLFNPYGIKPPDGAVFDSTTEHKHSGREIVYYKIKSCPNFMEERRL